MYFDRYKMLHSETFEILNVSVNIDEKGKHVLVNNKMQIARILITVNKN